MSNPEVLRAFLRGRISVVTGNITDQQADAIVNAANSALLGGGGVDGAIHRAGGPRILAECKEIRQARFPSGLPTGLAVITTGGNLPAQYVIHAVGPIFGRHNGREGELLADCYRNSLELAVEHRLKTIAFPSISTGAFSYPREEAASVSSAAIRGFLASNDSLAEIRLVFYARSDANVFLANHNFESEE